MYTPCLVFYTRTIMPIMTVVSFQPCARVRTTEGSSSAGRVNRDSTGVKALTIDETFGEGVALKGTLPLRWAGKTNSVAASALRRNIAHGLAFLRCASIAR